MRKSKHVQAAAMRARGVSIERIMQRFCWSREIAYYAIWRGRNVDKVSARAKARRAERRRAAGLPLIADNSERNARIIAMVKGGATFKEAAAEIGVSDRVVAGVCDRACVKAKPTKDRAKRIHARRSAASLKGWEKRREGAPA